MTMADADQSQTDSNLGTSDGSPPNYESLFKTEQGKTADLARDNEKLGKDLRSLRCSPRPNRRTNQVSVSDGQSHGGW